MSLAKEKNRLLQKLRRTGGVIWVHPGGGTYELLEKLEKRGIVKRREMRGSSVSFHLQEPANASLNPLRSEPRKLPKRW